MLLDPVIVGDAGERESDCVCMCVCVIVSSRAGPSAAGTPPPGAMSAAARCTFANLSKVRQGLFSVSKQRTGRRQLVDVGGSRHYPCGGGNWVSD